MKKLSSILLIGILAITFGCTKDDPTPNPNNGGNSDNGGNSSETVNESPTCSITTPQNGATFAYDENINVSVFAEDSDGTIAKVSLYIDNVGHSEMTAFPYNFTIVSGVLSPGTHTIKAIAKDNGGSNGEASVTITIEEPATESPDFVTFSDGQIPQTWQTVSWYVDNTGGHDDIYSLKVDGEGSVMTTKTIQGNGHLEFYAKSNLHYSFNDTYTPSLKLYIDGSTSFFYTVETIGLWKKYIIDLTEGTHTFLWEFYSTDNGHYCNIDAIKFVHNSTILRIGDYHQGGYIGHLNTREHGLIISISDLGETDARSALTLCNNYSNDGYYDWSAPTINELENIANSLYLSNISNLMYGEYWTCNIYSSTTYYYVPVDCSQPNGLGGTITHTSQNAIKQVRAIRTF